MLCVYATAALICLASAAVGRAILSLAGARRPPWLSAATGLAALVVASPLLVRLPGRATTAAVILAIAVAGCAVLAYRDLRRVGDDPFEGAGVAVVVIALASVPFLVSGHTGVLGEGVYTNDHAAQLYWADWLAHGFGPEPSAVRFGYPIGPQSVTVIAAQALGCDLVAAFNGLLMAIAALTGVTALGALGRLPTLRRLAVASLAGIPYLAASFLAQSAFKETAMALFVLAFALLLQALSAPEGAAADERPASSWRVGLVIGVLLAAASVFTFSIPGLAWFGLAIAIWLALEALVGRSPVDWRAVVEGVREHRAWLVGVVAVAAAVAILGFGPAREFVSKIGDVQSSAGRLSSPVFGGEALGIWPAGDFRIVRGEVTGATVAVAVAALALAYGMLMLWRRRGFGLLAMLLAGGAVYLGTRAFAQIHVQAKALVVISPLALLVALRGLLDPPLSAAGSRDWTRVRYACGALLFVAAGLSTLLALRDAPVGFDGRQRGLERLAVEADGATVAFLGVDRFGGYYLRGTLARAPAGYVPEEIAARPEKTWQQGDPADFDSLKPGQLDKFDYAITTAAAFGSTPPPNFERVGEAGDYVLWKRTGPTPRSRVLDQERGAPGAVLDCGDGVDRPGTAVVLPRPIVAGYEDWKTPAPPRETVAGQERGFQAPGTATTTLRLPRSGTYALSLQYQSQVPLEVVADGRVLAELPASLEGMYLSGAGRGPFWPAGSIESSGGDETVSVRAEDPGGLAAALGARRLVWLGDLAASPAGGPRRVALARACGSYVDRFAYARRGGGP